MKLDELKRLCIPVSERLPETNESTDVVAILNNKEITERAYYVNVMGVGVWHFASNVTYIGDRPEVTMWLDLKILIKK